MSWNGEIPRGGFKTKGLRNKRNKKSPKAILAKLAKQAERAAKPRFDRHSPSEQQQWE